MSEERFDCVKMMREIRDRIAAEEEGMTWEQRRDRERAIVENSDLFKRLFSRPGANPKPVNDP